MPNSITMTSPPRPFIIALDSSEERDSKYLDCSNKFLALNAEGKYVLFDFSANENVTPDEIFEIKFNNEDNQGFIDTIETIKKVRKDGTLSVENEDLRTSANQFLGSKIYKSGFSDNSGRVNKSDHIDTETDLDNTQCSNDSTPESPSKEISAKITTVSTTKNKNILKKIKNFFVNSESGSNFIPHNVDFNNNVITNTETTKLTIDVIKGPDPKKAEEANAHLLKKLEFLKYDFGISKDRMEEILELVMKRDKLNEKPFKLLSDKEKDEIETRQNQIDEFTPEEKNAVNIFYNSCSEATAHFVSKAAFGQSIQFTGPVAIKKGPQPDLANLFIRFLDQDEKQIIINSGEEHTNPEITDSLLISKLNRLESNFIFTRVGKGATGHFIVLYKNNEEWFKFDPNSPEDKKLTKENGTMLTEEGKNFFNQHFQSIPYDINLLEQQINLTLKHRTDLEYPKLTSYFNNPDINNYLMRRTHNEGDTRTV